MFLRKFISMNLFVSVVVRIQELPNGSIKQVVGDGEEGHQGKGSNYVLFF